MFAAVRWFHVCPGAKENKRYYHPDRKLLTLFYVVPIILLPYILNPASHASWLLVKGYYPLTHFFYCAVLLFNYFGKVRQWRRWLSSGIAASVLVSIAAALLLAVSLMPECKINEAWEHTLNSIIIAVGLLMTIYCGAAVWQVWQWIHEYSTDNFSNIDDFPLPYARGVIVIPIIHALLIWPMVLLDSPKWLATMQLLLAVFNIFFLISALPSKRKGNPLEQMIEDNREADNEEVLEQTLPTEEHPEIIEQRPKERQMDIPEQTRQKIADGIEKALVRQRLYLNPNLRLKEVVDVCGYSQAYVSRVLREQYGGFFDYVNILRCRHVDEYIARHPEVTKEEAIIKSGFKDRQNYYRIKKHLFQNDSQED
jgi:AraC-like DNA-binding protein